MAESNNSTGMVARARGRKPVSRNVQCKRCGAVTYYERAADANRRKKLCASCIEQQKITEHECPGCGKSIHKTVSHCNDCNNKLRREKAKNWFECEHCNERFFAQPSSTNPRPPRFCSVDCYRAALAKIREQRDPVAYALEIDAPFSKLVDCTGCGRLVHAKHRNARLMCDACKDAALTAKEVLAVNRQCEHCGDEFVTNDNRQKCCSDDCRVSYRRHKANEWRRQFRKVHGGDRKHRERAKRFGVEYAPINSRKVFERDGWKCQICGKQTPERHRGKRYPNAPELDHRVPMSKGGPHTYDNVQCACRNCNCAKNAKRSTGQLPLFTIG